MISISSWTIRKQLTLLLGVSVVVILSMVALNVIQTAQLRTLQDEGAARAADAVLVTSAGSIGQTLYQVIADAELNLKFDESRAAWAAARKGSEGLLAECEKRADTTDEHTRVREATARYDEIVGLFETQMLPKLESAKSTTDETRAIDAKIDEATTAIGGHLTAYVKSIQAEMLAGDQAFDRVAATYSILGLVVGIVGLLVALGAGVFLMLNVNRRLQKVVRALREGADQVASAASQVSSASQSLSQGSSEQAASLEENSASMEEMASMTRQTDQNTQEATALMGKAVVLVGQANEALRDMDESMTGIKESSHKVSKILKTIDEIAFQTNILALNAAVEAARAGEAGKGFAVVADEVRSLAQRAGQAAKDTAALIEESLTRSQVGEAKVVRMGESIAAITESAGSVQRLVTEVSVATRQQTQGIEQVSQAIAQMEKVTQTTAATAEESAAASEELSAQAETSLTIVADLEALVGGASAVPVVARQAAPAGRTRGKVIPHGAKPRAASARRRAEDLIPMENTGTFGAF